MTHATLSWIVAAVLAAAVAPAHAGGAVITPPGGWHSDPEQATALGQRAVSRGATTATEAYAPEQPGIALFATRVTWPAAGAEAGAQARRALDDLRASPRRATLAGGNGHETAWKLDVDAAAKQIAATIDWADPAGHTVDRTRLVIASDGSKVVAVTGECLARDDADRAGLEACQAALGSLDTGIAAASRVAIALPDTAPEAAATAMPSMAPTKGLDDGTVRLPPTAIALDPAAPDRRPMYVGAGILVLAALFWWNRRNREQLERAELRAERKERRTREERREDRRRRDADGDDLHAAARGDDAGDGDDLDVNSGPRDPS